MTNYKGDEVNKIKNNFSFQELYSICKDLNRENDRLEKIVITSKKIMSPLIKKKVMIILIAIVT